MTKVNKYTLFLRFNRRQHFTKAEVTGCRLDTNRKLILFIILHEHIKFVNLYIFFPASVAPPKSPQKLSTNKTQIRSSLEIPRSWPPSKESTRQSRSLTPSKSWASFLSRGSSVNSSMHSGSKLRSPVRSLNRLIMSKSPGRSSNRSGNVKVTKPSKVFK